MKKNKRAVFFVAALLGVFFVTTGGANAETKTFDVTEDTFINETYPDNNYGSAGSIVVGNEPIDRFGFLQFEEVSIPEDSVLDEVNLEIYVYDNSYDGSGWVRVGLIEGNEWEEDEPTWNGPYPAPIMSVGNFIDINLNFSTGWKEIDVTEYVKKWLSGDKEQRGLYVYPNGGDIAFSFRSKEHGSNAPALEVEYHEEEEYEFDLMSPEDEEVVTTTRIEFEWEEIDSDSDVEEYLLIAKKIIDDGDDEEEIVNETMQGDDTTFKIEEDLEEGDYVWYVEALKDDESSIFKTKEWEFSVKFPEEEDEETDEMTEDETDVDGEATGPFGFADETYDGEESEGEESEESEEEKGMSGWNNLLFVVVGIAVAAIGYALFTEFKKRKEGKEKQGAGGKKKEKTPEKENDI